MNLKEAYLAGHEACGLKVGDQVKIIQKAEDKQAGWSNCWNQAMDKYIGTIHTITDDGGIKGFQIKQYVTCYFPWFVLEKVEEEKKSTNIVDMNGLDFGCQHTDVAVLVSRILTYIDRRIEELNDK